MTKAENAAEATGLPVEKPYTVSVSYDVAYVETYDVEATSPEQAVLVALEQHHAGEGGRGGHYADDAGPSYVDCVAQGKVLCPFSGPQLPFPIQHGSPVDYLCKTADAFVQALIASAAVDLQKTDLVIEAYRMLYVALHAQGLNVKHLPDPVI